MQAWIVNHFALTPDQPGGTRHIELAKQLAEQGIDVTIVGAGQQHISDRNHVPAGRAWHRDMVQGVRFHWVATPSSSPKYSARIWNNIVFASSIAARRGLKDLPRPDVIVGTSPDLMSAFAAYLTAKVFGAPFVLEIRDIWPQSAVEIGLFSRHHPFILALSQLEKFLYRNADWIVTLLPLAHKHIIPRGGDAQRITWVPNGFTIGEQAFEVDETKRVPKNFTLMYAGSHGNANNLESLLEAARILKSRGLHETLEIKLIGDGPNKDALRQQAIEMELDFVGFEPAVPKNEIGAILSQADAFCIVFHGHSVYRHGISANKLYDYLAVGRPIIIALDSEYNPVVEASAGIAIGPDQPSALADAIQKLMQTPDDERREMGVRARTYAVKNHSMKFLGNRFAEVLQRVCDRHAESRD
ncbi:glycosyltransferase family 4 protein [Tepidicaulis sp. LMO-SS28]|uniref:glycosyltransferase family 4 protein n=1 Tax=Tepidicaulis sp. LMO-SS28 TaxID=3447455 RepID=UPI003EE3F4B9